MIWELLCYAGVFLGEAIASWIYFEYIFERKQSRSFTIATFVLGYIILFFLSQLIKYFANGVAFILINALLVYGNYSCGKASGILQVFYVTLMVGGSELLASLLLAPFTGDLTAYSQSLPLMMAFTVSGRLLFFLIMLFSTRLFHSEKYSSRSTGLPIFLSLFPATSILLITVVLYMGIKVKLDTLLSVSITFCALILLFLNALVVLVYQHIQKLNEENTLLQLEKQREKSKQEYYEILKKQYENQRILVHDFKNYLYIMEGMASCEQHHDLKQYVTAVLEQPGFQTIRFCENQVLNMIIMHYQTLCAEKSIDFSCDIRHDTLEILNDAEITNLFGNLLSNAFESAVDSQEKEITLCIMKQQGGSFISLTNSCKEPPVRNNTGNFSTQKKDPENHGIGMKSINRIVKTHEGISSFYYDMETNRFHSTIHFLG